MESSHNNAKGVLLLSARYNKHANNAMCAVFARLEREGRRELLYKDVGLYYQSIIGTAAHSLIGSLALFVGQIAHFTQGGRDYAELLSYLTPEFGLADSVLNDIAAFSALQGRVDSACIEIIESIGDFARVEELRVGEGVSFKRSVSHLILGMLHHSTHHRGQIAGALDMLGVENDFAGALLGME